MKSVFRINDVTEIDDSAHWGKLISPVYAYLEMTKVCNCNCEFCQVENLHAKNSDMSYKLFKKIIKHLEKNNFLEVRLGGGEPLLYKNLYKAVNFINKHNLVFWVCTNGILLDLKMAEYLKKNGCVGVRVSIDSCTKDKHNKIRNNNLAYDGAWSAIDNANKVGLQAVVSMTIGDHNISEVAELELKAKERGAKFITHPIMPIGRGVNFKNEQCEYFCNSIENKKMIQKSNGEKHCVAGSEMIAFDVFGNVSPCTFVKPKFSIVKQSLKSILKKDDMLKYKYPISSSDKCKKCDLTNKKGIECKYSDLCRGGCWALEEINNEN